VGEAARHYYAETALLVLLGSAGWLTALDRVLALRDRAALAGLVIVAVLATVVRVVAIGGTFSARTIILGSVALVVGGAGCVVGARWLARRGRLATVGPAVLMALLALGALGVVGVRAVRLDASRSVVESEASRGAAAWIRANVPAGTVVAFGPYLSMETSIDMPAGSHSVEIRHYLATADPSAPLGLRSAAGGSADWVAVDAAPGKASQFNVYDAAQLVNAFRTSGARYYVYPVPEIGGSTEVLNVLEPADGFTEVATLRYTGRSRTVTTHIYRVDLDGLTIPPNRLFIAAEALERLVDRLERQPAQGRTAAAGLLERIVPPAGGSLDVLLARLRQLAGS
jgi:hypothetical protein